MLRFPGLITFALLYENPPNLLVAKGFDVGLTLKKYGYDTNFKSGYQSFDSAKTILHRLGHECAYLEEFYGEYEAFTYGLILGYRKELIDQINNDYKI